jgi:methyltransferase (TIGR00027 family)
MNAGHASRTAVLVCQGRAVAQGRIAPARFDDPTAMQMLSDGERAPVERARSAEPPQRAGDRMEYEMLRANAEVIVPRTLAIDDAVRTRLTAQLVILGAGLDGRAWRMSELAAVEVFEVDHPRSQDDKRSRVGSLEQVARTLHFVPVDFTQDDLDTALKTAGHVESIATTWIWEGVVPYLTRADVEATVRTIGRRSAPGSRLVVNYQSPSLAAAAGRLFARAVTVLSRRPDPLAHEPRRSSWTADSMRALLRGARFTVVSDDDLLTIAGREGITVSHPRSLSVGRVTVADR